MEGEIKREWLTKTEKKGKYEEWQFLQYIEKNEETETEKENRDKGRNIFMKIKWESRKINEKR